MPSQDRQQFTTQTIFCLQACNVVATLLPYRPYGLLLTLILHNVRVVYYST